MSDIFKNIIDYADLHSGFMTLVTAILVPTSIAITRYGLRIVFIIMMPVFWIKENSGYFLISFKIYKKIRIATFGNAFDYLPFAVAKRNGYFQKSFFGYRIGYDKYECLEDIEEKIKLDEVNIIFLAAAPAIRLFMSGYPIRIFGK